MSAQAAVKRTPLERFYRHFGHPAGGLGRLAGRVMAWENRAVNRLVVELLAVRPGDAVLDVGCGPGVAVALAAQQAREGVVAGVDPSPVMVAQARRRNRRIVREGRATVVLASAEALPFAAGQFTAALSVNAIGHWDDAATGLAELRRVLAPHARVVLALRGQHDATSRDPHARGATPDRIAHIVELLRASWFGGVERRNHAFARETLVTLSAHTEDVPVR